MLPGFRKVSGRDAAAILADVAPEKSFWVNNGPVLRNVYELLTALKSMDDGKFSYHSGKEKSDFANWAADVLRDSVLARRLGKSGTRLKAAKAVSRRISELEKACDK